MFGFDSSGSRNKNSRKNTLFRFLSVKTEIEEMNKVYKNGVIHPTNKFRQYWDVIGFILIFINAFHIPFQICFIEDDFIINTNDWGLKIKMITDLFFICDLYMNFMTAYYDASDHLVAERHLIYKHYAETWLVIDFIAAFPLDVWIQGISIWLGNSNNFDQSGKMFHTDSVKNLSQVSNLLKLAKITALFRLFRLTRLVRTTHQLEDFLDLDYGVIMSYGRLAGIFVVILMWLHIDACLQYKIYDIVWCFGETGEELYEKHYQTSWIVADSVHKLTPKQKWLWSFFRATSHLLSIGYGVDVPMNIIDCWTTMLSEFIGCVIFAGLIAQFVSIFQKLQRVASVFQQKMNKIHTFNRIFRLNPKLAEVINDATSRKYHSKVFDEAAIMNSLNSVLRAEIYDYGAVLDRNFHLAKSSKTSILRFWGGTTSQLWL